MDILSFLTILALFSEDNTPEQTDEEKLQKIIENEKRFRKAQNKEEVLEQKKKEFLEKQQQQQRQHLEFLMFAQRTWEKQQNDKRWQEYWKNIEKFWQEYWKEIADFWEVYWDEIEQNIQEEKLQEFLRQLENALEDADIIYSSPKL